jgi:hypothetical protein
VDGVEKFIHMTDEVRSDPAFRELCATSADRPNTKIVCIQGDQFEEVDTNEYGQGSESLSFKSCHTDCC